jgi:hypothetical protein
MKLLFTLYFEDFIKQVFIYPAFLFDNIMFTYSELFKLGLLMETSTMTALQYNVYKSDQ